MQSSAAVALLLYRLRKNRQPIENIHRRRHRGNGGSITHFYSSMLVNSFAVSGGLSPSSKKIFRLTALAIIIPPTSKSESAPLILIRLNQTPIQ
jgi:hypothetical protein